MKERGMIVKCKYCNKSIRKTTYVKLEGFCSDKCSEFYLKLKEKEKFINSNTVIVNDAFRIVFASNIEELENLSPGESTCHFNVSEEVFPNFFLIIASNKTIFEDYDDNSEGNNFYTSEIDDVYIFDDYIKDLNDKKNELKLKIKK